MGIFPLFSNEVILSSDQTTREVVSHVILAGFINSPSILPQNTSADRVLLLSD